MWTTLQGAAVCSYATAKAQRDDDDDEDIDYARGTDRW